MSNLSDFMSSTAAKGLFTAQPGSNGFWRREIFRNPGTFTWTAKKDGKIKIQAIGAASGGCAAICGTSGGFGEKELTVTAGQTLTVVVGKGSDPSVSSSTSSAAATSTSISGVPVGGTPLTIAGAAGVNYGNPASAGAPGAISGPWDLSYQGAKVTTGPTGSPSSASPFGPGRTTLGRGGAGWFADNPAAGSNCGDGTHSLAASGATDVPGEGFVSKAGRIGASDYALYDGQSQPFWDLRDADGGGGFGSNYAGKGGVGAGGGGSAASNNQRGNKSMLGGGSGVNDNNSFSGLLKSGFGAGGNCGSDTGKYAGYGGDAFVMIFFDEVG